MLRSNSKVNNSNNKTNSKHQQQQRQQQQGQARRGTGTKHHREREGWFILSSYRSPPWAAGPVSPHQWFCFFFSPPIASLSIGHFVFKQVQQPQRKLRGFSDLLLVTLWLELMLIIASGSTVKPVGPSCHMGALMIHHKGCQQLPPPPKAPTWCSSTSARRVGLDAGSSFWSNRWIRLGPSATGH